VEIILCEKCTELAVAHQQLGRISAVLTFNGVDDISPPAQLSAGELHIGIYRRRIFRKLDLSGTSATEFFLQTKLRGFDLVPPPQLRHLHGQIGKGMDPDGAIWQLIGRNQAHHSVSALAPATSDQDPPRPSSAAPVLCLGEALHLLNLLDEQTGFSKEENWSYSVPSLCQRQAVLRELFGPALRKCLGDAWVDSPGIRWDGAQAGLGNPLIENHGVDVDSDGDAASVDSQASDEEQAVARSAHAILIEIRGKPGTREHGEYIENLVEALEKWPPVRQYIQHYSGLQAKCDTALNSGLTRLNRDKKFTPITTGDTDLSQKIRREWVSSQLHEGNDILLESPPPELQSYQRLILGELIDILCIKPSSPYNAQTLVAVNAYRNSDSVTRITPRAMPSDPSAAAQTVAEYDITTEIPPHGSSFFSLDTMAYFSLPVGTSKFRIYGEKEYMLEFDVESIR
jgi:hypothetical protein